MMSDEPKSGVEYRKRAGSGVVYSDYLNVNWNYPGFKVFFAAYTPMPADGEGSCVEEVAAVGPSPEHAKQLHRILGEQIQKYEERFGNIRPEPKPAEGRKDSE